MSKRKSESAEVDRTAQKKKAKGETFTASARGGGANPVGEEISTVQHGIRRGQRSKSHHKSEIVAVERGAAKGAGGPSFNRLPLHVMHAARIHTFNRVPSCRF